MTAEDAIHIIIYYIERRDFGIFVITEFRYNGIPEFRNIGISEYRGFRDDGIPG